MLIYYQLSVLNIEHCITIHYLCVGQKYYVVHLIIKWSKRLGLNTVLHESIEIIKDLPYVVGC